MNSPSHDFVTADMRGLKSALVARARAQRVSVSAVLRRAVERELGHLDSPLCKPQMPPQVAAASIVKLSIRLTGAEAEQLAAGATRAGLSRGAFLAGLLAGVPSLSGVAPSRPDCIAALTASNAELSTLTQNIYRLVALLRQGEVEAAHGYRELLDILGDEVRTHLRLAGSVLAGLRPARGSGSGDESPTDRAPRT
jgi:hypothetical protein